jgi:hypothetical protein
VEKKEKLVKELEEQKKQLKKDKRPLDILTED